MLEAIIEKWIGMVRRRLGILNGLVKHFHPTADFRELQFVSQWFARGGVQICVHIPRYHVDGRGLGRTVTFPKPLPNPTTFPKGVSEIHRCGMQKFQSLDQIGLSCTVGADEDIQRLKI